MTFSHMRAAIGQHINRQVEMKVNPPPLIPIIMRDSYMAITTEAISAKFAYVIYHK